MYFGLHGRLDQKVTVHGSDVKCANTVEMSRCIVHGILCVIPRKFSCGELAEVALKGINRSIKQVGGRFPSPNSRLTLCVYLSISLPDLLDKKRCYFFALLEGFQRFQSQGKGSCDF